MDFRMTEEQELLLDGLRELMERECSEDYIKQCDAEGRPPVEFYKALVDNGYGLLGCPESVGGTPGELGYTRADIEAMYAEGVIKN